jgi:putative ABC transport system ATP-binding protein
MSTPVLQLRDIHKGFRQGAQFSPVLHGVDLDLYPSEMLFLAGPSGCGKTTLLSVLCGTLHADTGEIHAFGHALHSLSPSSIARFRASHLGFVFQQFNLIPTLTAGENVAVPLHIQGVPPREARQRAHAMLERVGIPDKAGERPARLSGGQQQRVAIARALVHQPRLVVCDEPTSALDSATGHKVMTLLQELTRDDGRSAIVVTHDARIYPFADRMGEMEDGRIRRILPTPDAIAAAHPHCAP